MIGRGLALTLGLTMGLIACGRPWMPVATPADATRAQAMWPATTVDELNRGRTLVLRRCSSCHQPPSPSQRTAAEWPAQVAAMAERAGLEPDEHPPLTHYLQTFGRDQVARP